MDSKGLSELVLSMDSCPILDCPPKRGDGETELYVAIFSQPLFKVLSAVFMCLKYRKGYQVCT